MADLYPDDEDYAESEDISRKRVTEEHLAKVICQ